jgi:hypothetical protein
MSLELIEQRLAALEQEVSALKRCMEELPLSAVRPTRENGTGNPGPTSPTNEGVIGGAGGGQGLLAPSEETNPWLRIVGILDHDDPLVKEWIEIMRENRKEADEDPDYL